MQSAETNPETSEESGGAGFDSYLSLCSSLHYVLRDKPRPNADNLKNIGIVLRDTRGEVQPTRGFHFTMYCSTNLVRIWTT